MDKAEAEPEATTLTQFLSLAAHDLKQPLNILQMYLGLIQRQANLDSETGLSPAVQQSLQSIQSTLTLISQWARSETHSIKRIAEPTSSSEWMDSVEKIDGVKLERDLNKTNQGDQERQFDRRLLRQTLQDMVHLLPKPITLRIVHSPWELELESPPLFSSDPTSPSSYQDALYQLAFEAGCAITRIEGFELLRITDKKAPTTRLKLRPL